MPFVAPPIPTVPAIARETERSGWAHPPVRSERIGLQKAISRHPAVTFYATKVIPRRTLCRAVRMDTAKFWNCKIFYADSDSVVTYRAVMDRTGRFSSVMLYGILYPAG